MSEYQYYDFRAIDAPLTAVQKAAVASLSSRSQVTNRRAQFTYNYGDFHGDVEQLMSDSFDMMLYVSNLGMQRLLFRLPKTFFDVGQCRDYFISDEIDHSNVGRYTLLDLNFNEDDNYSDWIEGEELLDDLLPLRDELMQGDYRVLYLAWLKTAEKALRYGDIDIETPEPSVPAGLQDLSTAQQAFAKLIELDEVLIQTAAENSTSSRQSDFKPEAWLDHMLGGEKNAYLLRLCRNESNLSLSLHQDLKALYLAHQARTKSGESSAAKRRSIGELLDVYGSRQQVADEKAERQAAILAEKNRQIAVQKRGFYLDQLSGRKNAIWQHVDQLVQKGQAKSYDQAATHLSDLQALAEREGEAAEFKVNLQAVISKFERRRAFLDRLRSNNLLA